jgi:hypothetical protein
MWDRIKTISNSVIAKFKSENPDFDVDFDSFVKELSTDEVVSTPFFEVLRPDAVLQQVTRLFETLIKDSYKRTKRLSRSSSQVPLSSSPGAGEARFARLIQQHQQQRQLLHARQLLENESVQSVRDVTVDGQRYRITRSRSPMDLDVGEGRSRPSSRSEGTVSTVAVPVREEDKEEEGTVENRDGTVESVVVV